jgi:hypothetical protein
MAGEARGKGKGKGGKRAMVKRERECHHVMGSCMALFAGFSLFV